MDKFEMIEKLSAKANVTFDEAREALEQSDWDILDAMILLEKQGKAKDAQTVQEFTTRKKEEYWQGERGKVRFETRSWAGRLWDYIKNLLHKGNTNQFVVTRDGEELISMPITVMVLLTICFWPFSLIVLFVGLFLKARYSFRGPNINDRVNDVMGSAQEKAASAVQIHRSAGDEDKKAE